MPASNGPVSGPNALILLNAFMSPHSSGEGTADDIVDGKSADRTSEDDPDSVKWEELPAPPLQIICSYLVDQPARIFGNYRQIEQVCKSLDAFRKTCRHFATAVNSFLKNSANLPLIGFIRVRDT
ncbi:hypothetical protein PRIPAC_71322, partial [Pristionchus pacificus]|uniref:Uncharacterized protein n=1 Tax=Pristionchus pacificus TaxID=54126 RepID=A0A2A6B5F6_PRIPA